MYERMQTMNEQKKKYNKKTQIVAVAHEKLLY